MKIIKELKNPKSILIQNEFYPSGLTEEDISNYYSKVKRKILSVNDNREVMLFIAVDINKFIIRRHYSNNDYIILTNDNYDEILHGRVTTIISTMKRYENFGIIDIDYHDFDKNKEITLEIIKYLSSIKISPFKSIRVRFTGKSSFHIIIYLNKNQDINITRLYLSEILRDKFSDKYDIIYKRSSDKPNLDLSPNKFRGGFISEFSLSVLGLRCLNIPINQIKEFEKRFAKIDL